MPFCHDRPRTGLRHCPLDRWAMFSNRAFSRSWYIGQHMGGYRRPQSRGVWRRPHQNETSHPTVSPRHAGSQLHLPRHAHHRHALFCHRSPPDHPRSPKPRPNEIYGRSSRWPREEQGYRQDSLARKTAVIPKGFAAPFPTFPLLSTQPAPLLRLALSSPRAYPRTMPDYSPVNPQ